MVLIFKSHPLLNTMVTYTVVWMAADVSEQKLISKKKHLDFDKTVRMATVGAVVMAPLVFFWLRHVERYFPGSRMKNVALKVVTEQIFFSPVAITSFYASTNILEGKLDIGKELRAKYMKTWKTQLYRLEYLALPCLFQTGLTFWPVVQTINQSFVPHHYKPVFIACASFVWTNFLCFMKEKNLSADMKEYSETPISS